MDATKLRPMDGLADWLRAEAARLETMGIARDPAAGPHIATLRAWAKEVDAAIPSDAPQAPDTIAPAGAVNLACYLVDHCEGETVTEESIQRWIGAMVKSPRYNPTVESELASMTRMFHAACADLGTINEALGLDPDDGGAEPIIGAIEELKAQIAAPVAPASAAPEIDAQRSGGEIAPNPVQQGNSVRGAEAQPDVHAACIEWANANGHTKYHESMCAAWEEATRRATQQATKGDERAALDVEILSGPCVNVCVTQDSKPKDQRFDVVVIRKTDFDKLTSARTTPSPVAGSAGQAPVVAAALIGLARHVRAVPAYAKLVGDMEMVDSAIGILETYAPTAPSLTTDAGAVLTEAQRTTINEAANIIAIFTGHDSYANLKQKFGDDPWTDVNKIAADLRALLAAHPTEQRMSDAARDVLAERARQVSDEGWTPLHDDKYQCFELADAAAAYAMHVSGWPEQAQGVWPWDASFWKPTTPRRDLTKAAALILAEIERIDRAARKGGSDGQ
ncbi:hypothetical protein B0G62_104105 [Paraburkholderia eburnea]|uniref:Uncharacterized protein n=1 Tax=Paraburkholderia eburnea TaxID=1189126 RepID=A0A2S4MDH7_9BURK|nr:hypothetical protein [Paraburkholderia eburnea]POR52808.1 hypothetical protein B0G62_104105 [Paraburkholderia eburnea]PRZ23676.1 hypothetical protein BX588_104105 [Paraburkholderia eburnea]